MYFPKFAVSLLFLTSTLLLQTAFGIHRVNLTCYSDGNFTANSPYQFNLNKLVTCLSIETPISGFATGSIGHFPDRVNGLALCKGDLTFPDCQKCVALATTELREQCQFNKAGIVWYNQCLLRYSQEEFIGQTDTTNRVCIPNITPAPNPAQFNQRTRNLLTQIAEEVEKSNILYATGELAQSGSDKLYGLAQCTRDVSPQTCKRCLDDIINNMQSCCKGTIGCRILTGSCYFRYELYPINNDDNALIGGILRLDM